MPKYTDTSGDTYTGIYEFMRLSLYSGACWIFEIQQFKAYDGDSGNFCNVSSAWSESADSTDLPDNLSDITVFDDTCSHISIESYSDANTGDITGMLNCETYSDATCTKASSDSADCSGAEEATLAICVWLQGFFWILMVALAESGCRGFEHRV